jgi:hypothetical protein
MMGLVLKSRIGAMNVSRISLVLICIIQERCEFLKHE